MRAPSDRSMTLMQFVAGIVREKYPNILEFVNEVTYLAKASTGKMVVFRAIYIHHTVIILGGTAIIDF